MRPTVIFLHEKYDRFNDLCFGGKLPKVELKLSRARNSAGNLRYRITHGLLGGRRYHSPVISVSTFYDRPESEVEDILIHEMIHLYILVNKLKDTSTHGVIFRKMMDQINTRHHRHITVSLKRSEEQQLQDMRHRIHSVCLSHLTNGGMGITISARTAIYELWGQIEAHPMVEKCEWYVTDNPYFNRFPHSRTLKIYKCNPEEVYRHLTDCLRLRMTDGRIETATLDEPI